MIRVSPISQKMWLPLIALFFASGKQNEPVQQKIFDAHLHFKKDSSSHLEELAKYNITGGAVSGSRERAELYRTASKQKLLTGLMLPCRNGIAYAEIVYRSIIKNKYI